LKDHSVCVPTSQPFVSGSCVKSPKSSAAEEVHAVLLDVLVRLNRQAAILQDFPLKQITQVHNGETLAMGVWENL